MTKATMLKNRSIRRKANRFRWAQTQILEPEQKTTLTGAEISFMLTEFGKIVSRRKNVRVKDYMDKYQRYPKNKS